MRVIAGRAKGRRLVGPEGRDTRPLTDRAREGIFSSLGDKVAGAVVADLFAGSGSIGIEALSRGAQRVVFVERGRAALRALRHNLAAVGLEEAVVVAQPVAEFLAAANASFDLIFCDPPWAMPTPEVEALMAAAARLAHPGSELILHRRRGDPDPKSVPGWREVTTRVYGDGKIYRYVKEET